MSTRKNEKLLIGLFETVKIPKEGNHVKRYYTHFAKELDY